MLFFLRIQFYFLFRYGLVSLCMLLFHNQKWKKSNNENGKNRGTSQCSTWLYFTHLYDSSCSSFLIILQFFLFRKMKCNSFIWSMSIWGRIRSGLGLLHSIRIVEDTFEKLKLIKKLKWNLWRIRLYLQCCHDSTERNLSSKRNRFPWKKSYLRKIEKEIQS